MIIFWLICSVLMFFYFIHDWRKHNDVDGIAFLIFLAVSSVGPIAIFCVIIVKCLQWIADSNIFNKVYLKKYSQDKHDV